jgi:hypothetical protein
MSPGANITSDRAEQLDVAPSGADESPPLQFVDLLYAVPIADLAVRVSATRLMGVTASGWSDIAVQLTAITLGWVGHHTNRRRLPPKLREMQASGRQFWTPRFGQFVVEILIIVGYFALGTRAYLPDGAGIGHPSESWKAGWLTLIFILYLVWDLFDIWIARGAGESRWEKRAWWGCGVTVAFAAIMFFGFYLAWASSYSQGKPYHGVVVFDVVLIVVLYAYRVTQEWLIRKKVPREEGSAAAPQ